MPKNAFAAKVIRIKDECWARFHRSQLIRSIASDPSPEPACLFFYRSLKQRAMSFFAQVVIRLAICLAIASTTWAAALVQYSDGNTTVRVGTIPAATGSCPCILNDQTGSQLPDLNICAKSAGDPSWCTFRLCGPRYVCAEDSQVATHVCNIKPVIGQYKCIIENGQIIKPRPHEKTRCKCNHFPKKVGSYLVPISSL